MNLQISIKRYLSNKCVFRIVSVFLTAVLILSVYMTGTMAWTSYVSRRNSFYGGGPGADTGLFIKKTLIDGDGAQLTDEQRQSLVFSFVVEIPSMTGPVAYTIYDYDTNLAVADGSVTPTGDAGDPNSIIQLKDGQYASLPDIPDGTWYRVSEIPAAGFETDSSGSSGHILAGGILANFTNTYCPDKTGALELRKTVVDSDSAASFDFDVSFEQNGVLYGGTVMVSYNAGEPQVFVNPGVVSLASGDSVSFTNLLPGIRYIVSERDYSGDNYYPAVGSFTGYISAGCDPIVLDANNYLIDSSSSENGSLSITKRVTGNSADSNKGFKFDVSFEYGTSGSALMTEAAADGESPDNGNDAGMTVNSGYLSGTNTSGSALSPGAADNTGFPAGATETNIADSGSTGVTVGDSGSSDETGADSGSSDTTGADSGSTDVTAEISGSTDVTGADSDSTTTGPIDPGTSESTTSAAYSGSDVQTPDAGPSESTSGDISPTETPAAGSAGLDPQSETPDTASETITDSSQPITPEPAESAQPDLSGADTVTAPDITAAPAAESDNAPLTDTGSDSFVNNTAADTIAAALDEPIEISDVLAGGSVETPSALSVEDDPNASADNSKGTVITDNPSTGQNGLITDEPLTTSPPALDVSDFVPMFEPGGSAKSSLDGIDGNTFHITLYPGETAKFGNIPEGIKYTVTEVMDSNSDGYIPSNESISGYIIGLVDKSIEFVNNKPDNMALHIMKQAISQPDEDKSKSFKIWIYINGTRQDTPIELKSGDSADIEIPVGAYYDVVEENYAGDGYITYVNHGSGLALSDKDITATITNTYTNGGGVTGTPTPTPVPGPTETITPTPVSGPTGTVTPTPTPISGPTSTNTPTPISGPTGTNTPTPIPGPSDTNTPTPTPISGPTNTNTPTPVSGPTDTPTPQPTWPAYPTDTYMPTPSTPVDLTPTDTPWPTPTTSYRIPTVRPSYPTTAPYQPTAPPNPTNTPTPPFNPTSAPIYTPTPDITPSPAIVIGPPSNTPTPASSGNLTPPESGPPTGINTPAPGGEGGGYPQTGDTSNPAPWLAVMILSALLLRYVLSHKSVLLGK